ncbi:Uncharacterized membrane protein YdjX, TVP38/TMEM64 family, SNARE-associated domain [Clostridium collagenovorans DSM 3089]|uniref:TVP38/TMEM64 family membrane protein n=1 Tax=Clostridium collagenovorans DSM 3089 TaxID=1121306 RepID=A0A1M5VX77_9CLOT|nr:TVP38/TMEM64 family protein [Clostridium collagenovorans]SHH79909.1 Uncharacterized membrane protein YdjX, TVP38/TMEM64 family, SNARE-associated domain [Clostridium collagenovorans DSM 3089]
MDEIKKFKEHLKNHWGKYLLAVIVVVACIYILKDYIGPLVIKFSDFETVRNFINKYENHSVLVFIILQILQVVIFAIPGEVIQISGGYLFGYLWGFVYSLIGITLGSAICFFIARTLGKKFVGKIISKEKILYYEEKLNSNRYRIGLFILYLIPGVPKDLLAYVAGISKISLSDFLMLSTIARIPALFLSSYFGSKVIERDMKSLIIVGIIVVIILVMTFIKKDKIMSYISEHKKHSKEDGKEKK